MFLNELPKELIKPYLSLAQALMSADGKLEVHQSSPSEIS